MRVQFLFFFPFLEFLGFSAGGKRAGNKAKNRAPGGYRAGTQLFCLGYKERTLKVLPPGKAFQCFLPFSLHRVTLLYIHVSTFINGNWRLEVEIGDGDWRAEKCILVLHGWMEVDGRRNSHVSVLICYCC